MVRKDGTILPVLLNSTSVTDPDGNFVRSRTTVYDNSRLKAAEEQHRKLQAELDQSRRLEAIGQLTAGIAHDFNNVLQGIMSNLELVDDDIEVPAATREYVGTAVRLAEQAGELVHNLLSFARKQILLPHEVDLDDFLNRFQRLLSRTLDPRVRIDVVTDPGLAPVWVDARHLQTALLNLAINARDAMPSGGNLRIEAFGNRAAAASGPAGAGADAEGFVGRRQPSAGPLHRHPRERYRHRHSTQGPGKGLRTVLQHQGGEWHRSWIVDGARFRQAIRRRPAHLQRAGQGNLRGGLAAAWCLRRPVADRPELKGSRTLRARFGMNGSSA